jgi:hypothetical protein
MAHHQRCLISLSLPLLAAAEIMLDMCQQSLPSTNSNFIADSI